MSSGSTVGAQAVERVRRRGRRTSRSWSSPRPPVVERRAWGRRAARSTSSVERRASRGRAPDRREPGLRQVLLARLEHDRDARRNTRSRTKSKSARQSHGSALPETATGMRRRSGRRGSGSSPAMSGAERPRRRGPRGRRSPACPRRRCVGLVLREHLAAAPRGSPPRPRRPSRPIPVSTTPSTRRRTASATERNSTSTAGRQKFSGGSWLRADARRRPGRSHDQVVLARRDQTPAGRERVAVRGLDHVERGRFASSRSASIFVNSGGMCCTITTGTGSLAGQRRNDGRQRVRPAGGDADREHVHAAGASGRRRRRGPPPARRCGRRGRRLARGPAEPRTAP